MDNNSSRHLEILADPDPNRAKTELVDEVDLAFTPEVGNADNQLLGALRVGPNRIGSVDFVNGARAAEVPTFTPTIHELEVLFSYWADQELDTRLFIFMTDDWSSNDSRIRDFARGRVNRIWATLGKEHGQRLWAQAYEEFWSKETDLRIRACFESGKVPPRVAEKWANGELTEEADWEDIGQ